MINRVVHYSGGDSYANEIIPYLEQLYPQTCFKKCISVDEVLKGDWLLLFPAVSEQSAFSYESIPSDIKILVLLDLNHFQFNDYLKILERIKANIVFTPIKLNLNIRQRIIPSVYLKYINSKVTLSKQIDCQHLVLCTQPLLEDRPKLGVTQVDVFFKARYIAQGLGLKLAIKLHPRDTAIYGIDNEQIIYFNKPITELLANHSHWVGYNSIVLHAARELGHKVFFLEE